MSTLTARIDDWLDEEIRRFWDERGVGPSSGFRRVAQEWWALQRFPRLEFRDGVTGRRAGIRGGPDVWEVVQVAREVDDDLEALEDHFGGYLGREALAQAVEYGKRFPEPIEEMIRENERVGRMLAAAAGDVSEPEA